VAHAGAYNDVSLKEVHKPGAVFSLLRLSYITGNNPSQIKPQLSRLRAVRQVQI
jgi:hypothetical protein